MCYWNTEKSLLTKADLNFVHIFAWFLCEIWTLKHFKSRQDTAYSRTSETLGTNSYNAHVLNRGNYFASYS